MSFKKINNVEFPSESVLTKILNAIHTRVATIFYTRNINIKDNLNNRKVGVRTGRLRNAQQANIKRIAYTIDAAIFNNVSYAPILEHGFAGNVNVSEHRRKISQAFGKPIAPVTASVRAHSRYVYIKPHSFFYEELIGIEDEVEKSIDKIVEENL